MNSNWPLKKLKDIATLITGSTPSTQVKEYYGGNIPFVSPADMGANKWIYEAKNTLTALGKDQARSIPENSILLCCIGATIGKVGIAARGLVTNQQINSILFDERKVDFRYGYYFCSTLTPLLKGKSHSTTLPIISKGKLSDFKIPLPPLEEQKRIAAILDAADVLRQKDRALIAKYEQLTQSLFMDMFGDPFTGNTEKLERNIEVLGGYAFKSTDFVGTGVPVIKIGTVNKGYFDLDSFSFLPESYLLNYKKWVVEPGDILISLTGTVGKDDYGNVERATKDYDNYFLNQRVAKLKTASNKYLPGFLYAMMSHSKTKKALTNISRGVRQANISNRDILGLHMIVPDVEKQKMFVEAIKLIDEQKQIAEQSLKKSEELFNSLLQFAFKGELTQKAVLV